jgi:hypothetical protein
LVEISLKQEYNRIKDVACDIEGNPPEVSDEEISLDQYLGYRFGMCFVSPDTCTGSTDAIAVGHCRL